MHLDADSPNPMRALRQPRQVTMAIWNVPAHQQHELDLETPGNEGRLLHEGGVQSIKPRLGPVARPSRPCRRLWPLRCATFARSKIEPPHPQHVLVQGPCSASERVSDPAQHRPEVDHRSVAAHPTAAGYPDVNLDECSAASRRHAPVKPTRLAAADGTHLPCSTGPFQIHQPRPK